MSDAKSALPTVFALLATALSAVALPTTPAAAAEPCRTQVTGEEMPEGADPHPLIAQLGLHQTWDLSTGARVTVAVIDSGVDARHPDLDGQVDRGSEFTTVLDEREFEKSNPAPRQDCEGHGTAVAGLIAARRSHGDRMAGVAPDATVYPVRIADGVDRATPRTLAAAIDDAVAAGAGVINLSLAVPVDHEPIRNAIERALDADVLVVAAAGNEGNAKMYPAAYDGVLAVGAVGIDGQPLDSSNAGPWVDLAAIGEDVVVVAPTGEGYRAVDGTSFAAAQVSGAAALVRSRFPDLTAEQVAERLTGSATPLGGGPNDRTGAGLVDPFGALTHLEGDGGGDGDEASAGRIPAQALPGDEPPLSSSAVTGLAVSGVLLLTVLLVLLAAPGVRRAVRRNWRAGTAPGRTAPLGPRQGPPREPSNAPGPPAASLAWLDSGGEEQTRNRTANPTRNRM
ncbi:type VII secretion-associated serine protease mycosin [Streptomyces litchfieldiae]|uniref:Type VII secretion-associated serine protease mycosin n=1 Tax=Streptomyces litchfieldiae TaxID=3075543 RepID=A0ABU2MIE3_9ACTN|nr:type VII secretion-associated serine protease mycosin [Streptomyces sp. DSM 44938]MDT0341290.1 type VII secretion-associated serine protease mycosin [Streptomyces sp. DSM 44938]